MRIRYRKEYFYVGLWVGEIDIIFLEDILVRKIKSNFIFGKLCLSKYLGIYIYRFS